MPNKHVSKKKKFFQVKIFPFSERPIASGVSAPKPANAKLEERLQLERTLVNLSDEVEIENLDEMLRDLSSGG